MHFCCFWLEEKNFWMPPVCGSVYICVCVEAVCLFWEKGGRENILASCQNKKSASHRLQHLVIQVKHTHKCISAADGDLVDKLKNAKKRLRKRESRVFFVSRKRGKRREGI